MAERDSLKEQTRRDADNLRRVVEGRQNERREADSLRAGLHGILALQQSDDNSILRAVEALRDHEVSLAASLD